MPLYPKKNLLAGTEGFINTYMGNDTIPLNTLGVDFAPNPTTYAEVKGSYSVELNAPSNNINLKFMVPVKPNTYYKPSCETNGDIHIFYFDEKKTTRITQTYDTLSQNRTALTPASCYYIGVLLTNRGLGPGKYYFKNWQLEEVKADGTPATPFEPYELGMKKKGRVQKINNDMSSAGSHAYPYGNVISVKEDVRLWTANLKVYTTGTFNVIVQEFVEGVGRVGLPIFDRKMDITSLTDFTYSFGGVELKAGKTYWVGRLSTNPELPDNVGNAAVGRSTNMEARGWKYVDAIGGTSYRSATVDFTQTWYYFYGLEIEAVNMKKAVGVPKSNLIEPFGDSDYYYRPGAESNFTVINGRRLELNATADHQYFRYPFPVKPNTVYTISAKHNGKIGVYTNDGASGIVDYTTNQKATFNSGARADVRVYWTNIGLGNGKFFIEDLVVQEGTDDTYKAYELVMKPASLVPKKNLIPADVAYDGLSLTYTKLGAYKYQLDWVGGFDFFIRDIKVKRNTQYTVSLKKEVTSTDVTFTVRDSANGTIAAGSTASEVSFNSGANDTVTLRFARATGSAGSVIISELQLEEGTKTPFKPYELGMKPAILYPKKNYLLPFTQWVADNPANVSVSILEMSAKRVLMELNNTNAYAGLSMPLDQEILNQLRGKTVTLGQKTYNRSGVGGQIQLRFTSPSVGNVEYVLSSSGQSTTKFIPTDATAAFCRIQNNSAGYAKIEVDELQLEIGSAPTNWSPYELAMKQ